MRTQLFATLFIGLLSGACQAPPSQNVPRYGAPGAYGTPYASSEQACAAYGFTAGSAAFNRCVTRERAERSSGPVPPTAEAQMNADARAVCNSYGLVPGSAGYDRCVSNEINARRYREGMTQPSYPTYRTDQYGNRIDSQFNPREQTAVVRGASVQTPAVTLLGSVPITAGPTMPIATIDDASLSAIPAQRWQVVLHLNNNSAGTINPVIDCRFTNSGNPVEEVRANLPPVAAGQRVGLTIYGPQTTLFVDRADCRLASP